MFESGTHCAARVGVAGWLAFATAMFAGCAQTPTPNGPSPSSPAQKADGDATHSPAEIVWIEDPEPFEAQGTIQRTPGPDGDWQAAATHSLVVRLPSEDRANATGVLQVRVSEAGVNKIHALFQDTTGFGNVEAVVKLLQRAAGGVWEPALLVDDNGEPLTDPISFESLEYDFSDGAVTGTAVAPSGVLPEGDDVMSWSTYAKGDISVRHDTQINGGRRIDELLLQPDVVLDSLSAAVPVPQCPQHCGTKSYHEAVLHEVQYSIEANWLPPQGAAD